MTQQKIGKVACLYCGLSKTAGKRLWSDQVSRSRFACFFSCGDEVMDKQDHELKDHFVKPLK